MGLEKQFDEEFEFMKEIHEEDRKQYIKKRNKEIKGMCYFTLACATAFLTSLEIASKGEIVKSYYNLIKDNISNLF